MQGLQLMLHEQKSLVCLMEKQLFSENIKSMQGLQFMLHEQKS